MAPQAWTDAKTDDATRRSPDVPPRFECPHFTPQEFETCSDWGASTWGPKSSIFQLRSWLADSPGNQESQSIEVHRGLQPVLDFAQGLRRQSAEPPGQLGAVKRGHLMTHGKTGLRQAASAARQFYDGGPALALRR